MTRAIRVTLAFVFGLIGGILILTASLAFLPFYRFGGSFFFVPFGLAISLTSGILVILGTTLGYLRPEQGITWGIVVIVFGALSVLGFFGGFVIGMPLAITGGALQVAVATSGPMSSAGGSVPAWDAACSSIGISLPARIVGTRCRRSLARRRGPVKL